jgi:drug/metabolite transporter (DMT)-like permease
MSNKKGIIYALISALSLSSVGVFAKNLYEYENVDAELLFFSSLVFGVIVLFVMLVSKNGNLFPPKISRNDFILASLSIGFFGTFLPNLLSFKSLEYLNAGVQRAVVYSSPVFVLLINFFILRKKQAVRDVISVLLVVISLVLVVGKVSMGGDEHTFFGFVLAMLSCITFAIYSVIEENARYDVSDKISQLFYSTLSSLLLATIYMFVVGKIDTIKYMFHDMNLVVLLFLFALITFVLPYITLLKSIEIVGAVNANVLLAITPVASMILSMFLLGEHMSISQVIGVFLITAAPIVSLR